MHKKITATLVAGLVAFSVAGFAAPALADEIVPPTPEVTVEETPEAATETVVKDEKEPDVGYRLVLWVADEDGELWPQSYVADEVQPEPDINGLDEFATCGTYQADLYRDDEATASLIAGGYLNGPGDPYESWPGDGYQSSYSKQWTVTEGCETPEPPVFHTCDCEDLTVLPLATEENPQGWGDVKSAAASPWTADGLQLTATDTEEAYAYIDLADPVKLSTTNGSLDTDYSNLVGTFGVIIHTDVANVHYDNDGRYWTLTAGLFPETSPGFYSTYDLGEMMQEAYIDEVAVWVNPGGSLLLHSQEYPCVVQPFGAEPVVPVTPTPPTITTAELAYTGMGNDLTPLYGALGLLAVGGVLTLLKRRFA